METGSRAIIENMNTAYVYAHMYVHLCIVEKPYSHTDAQQLGSFRITSCRIGFAYSVNGMQTQFENEFKDHLANEIFGRISSAPLNPTMKSITTESQRTRISYVHSKEHVSVMFTAF